VGEPLSAADRALHDELTAELARLVAAPPHVVLAVPSEPSAAELRAAFLAATKRHHPSRHARRPRPIVRLANEIFLVVRGAHEKLRLAAGRADELRPPTVRDAELRPPSRHGAELRPSPPAAGQPARSGARPPTGPPPPSRPVTAPGAVVAPPAGHIDAELRAAISERRRHRLQTPPAGVSVQTPVRVSASHRVTGGQPIAAAPPAVAGPPSRQERLHAAEQQLAAGQLAEARAAFRALAAEKPDDRLARGLLHLAAGRELLAAGKPVEARAELERALAVDPRRVEARELLDGLDKSHGGLFSRWFRK
jgi:hypothetical protein